MYDLKNIKSVQIEITERCNAACPACQRNYFGYGSRPGIYKGNMSLEQFKTLLTEELLSQLNEVFFCGNFGDAQLNPHLPDMIDYMYNVNPDLWLCINTNGSMHNKEYWENFVKYDMQIVFAIDGTTPEIHSYYRRNTDYNKVIENARAYIDAGGKATWQFILFKHNEHQLEEAKKLAIEYKFNDIHIIKSDRPNNTPVLDNKGNYIGQLEDSTIDEYGYNVSTINLKENTIVDEVDSDNFDISQEVAFGRIINEKYVNEEKSWEKEIEEIRWVKGYLKGYASITDNFNDVNVNTIMRGGPKPRFLENRKIDCLAIEHSRIYITADGFLYPCCMMGLQHIRYANEYSYDVRELLKHAGLPNDVNNALKYGSIQKVFDSGFMNVIKQTWTPETVENKFIQTTINDEYGSKNGNLHICASTCSNCNIS